ncbi:ribosomal protein S18-alanine N-acetyltransferase [Neisseria chenwenguii]|uniref:[Ribosomal protein bS18]-alanine N-acetyltransferase n=1 Tax=Neisseria chenwenguii TaxID=1853278 RepID=A0A220S129_9NEIS|nr:ribosomal protein S18-alanine N-acetyltransferase [Neisseria chenwenguii]ASK27189.1 ribosomal-protein-alanine N-acetyltransferase [Neisseria chenwenguii]ROV54891.1 ribosomal-protein-alanine N-acetyltransferase [Neisseria chenwenguii]
MNIRTAVAADCARLAEIDAQSNPSAWSKKQFQSALNSRTDTVLVCEKNDVIQGFIVWQSVCGESELHLIAAAPECRRQGVASVLLERWFQTASSEALTRLFLEVRAANGAAQRLYRKYGFQECGRRKDYYPLANGREDAVLMEKIC